MHIKRSAASSEALLDPQHAAWQQAEAREFRMIPTPLKANPMIEAISPFLAQSTDHGTLNQLSAFGLHNGEALTLRLRWAGGERQQIRDLDEFVDGVAVMFPLHAKASAVTMGGKGTPVNAWYWKANRADAAFDVVAEGYGTSVRRDGASSAVRSQGAYAEGHWHVTLQRPLQGPAGHAQFHAGEPTRVAFALWDGANRERAGRKSFSGDFVLAELDA